jgi:hypothetical protein
MKIKLVFTDWQDRNGKSVYQSDLSLGQFHSGTTFPGEIELDEEDAHELEDALMAGNTPIFEVVMP